MQCPVTGARMSAEQRLKQPPVRLSELMAAGEIELETGRPASELDVATLETGIKYEGYLRRERSVGGPRGARGTTPNSRGLRRISAFPGLTHEVMQRLTEVRPETLGQAGRIPGVTPAAVAVLGMHVERYMPRLAKK